MSTTFKTGSINISRVALLTNPAAGKGRASGISEVAKQKLNHLGIDVVGIQGPTAEASEKLAEAMIDDDRIDALVVAGGDGLISLALQAQARSGKPLGIIPAGTGNDHAREYNLPTDPARAAEVIADGFWTTTDLGLARVYEEGTDIRQRELPQPVKERWFNTVACVGFDSLVSDRVNTMKWPTGKARYNLAIGAEVLNFRAHDTVIVLDAGAETQQVIETKSVLCAAGNTRSYGGGMKICPKANHHDGLLDLTVMKDIGRVAAAKQFASILKGTLEESSAIAMYRSSVIRLDMPRRPGAAQMNAYADGDPIAPVPVELEAVPGAGMFLTPRP